MPYIDDLDETYPDGATDPGSVLDDDLRDIKATILDCYPNVAGVVTPDHHWLNRVVGLTAPVQGQITNVSSLISTAEGASRVLSGLVSGTQITGPFGDLLLRDTWSVVEVAQGQHQVIHDMNISLGLDTNDYIVSVTPFGATGVQPVASVSQTPSSFQVNFYDHSRDTYIGTAFLYLIVLT
jgi:hypothetical protein